MNPEQLWDTTMDPETRLMKQVTIDDAEDADHIFDVLMGAEVAPRKSFIQTNAKSVKNLDIWAERGRRGCISRVLWYNEETSPRGLLKMIIL